MKFIKNVAYKIESAPLRDILNFSVFNLNEDLHTGKATEYTSKTPHEFEIWHLEGQGRDRSKIRYFRRFKD